jgi:hypothetical protein
MSLQGSRQGLSIVPGILGLPKTNTLLVALAAGNDHVARPRQFHGASQRRAPIRHPFEGLPLNASSLATSFGNFFNNGSQILCTWVFGSEDGEVGQLGRKAAHDWPLFNVS